MKIEVPSGTRLIRPVSIFMITSIHRCIHAAGGWMPRSITDRRVPVWLDRSHLKTTYGSMLKPQ